MIYDKIVNINNYGYDMSFIADYLSIDQFEKGRIDINGSERFVIGLEYNTKESELGIWEGHRKYLDIHVILEGEEVVEISDVANMVSVKPYEDDYELFEGVSEHKILLRANYFLLLFPHEIHKTGVLADQSSISVLKNVFKKLL